MNMTSDLNNDNDRNDNDRKILLAIELTMLPGVGKVTQTRVWRQLAPDDNLSSLPEDRLIAIGVPRAALTPLRQRSFRDAAEKTYAWARRQGIHVLIAGGANYPRLLEEIYDPPLVLYARGCLAALERPGIAIVGTRQPTLYGVQSAEELGAALGGAGLAVISGLARGIDAAAHRGCLSRDGVTIAVLGSGIDIIYPREHQHLATRISAKGLLISEFIPGTAPAPHNFPVRNRIVSGMTLGTLVIEAGERSGSLITARLAMEQNREVFALPGNITSPQSLGPNFLLKQGAKLVQSYRDIIEELPATTQSRLSLPTGATSPAEPAIQLTPENAQLLDLLQEDEALHFDALLMRCGGNISRLSAGLMELESTGCARQLPGNLYVKLRTRPRVS